MNKQELSPREVVVDVTLAYSATMPRLGHAAVLNNTLVIATKNHRGQFVSFGLPINFDGEPFDGDSTTPPRFVLRRIHTEVWKLSPSILHDLLHAFVTIVGVPEGQWAQVCMK